MQMDGWGLPSKWAIKQRLMFIEARLYWAGRVNRTDLIDQFGIQMAQASKDLTLYQTLAPANIVYDKSHKTYRASDRFAPLLLNCDTNQMFAHLKLGNGWIGVEPETATMPAPARAAPPDTMRSLMQAIGRREAVDIHYQSLSWPEPTWRHISPHAFGNDGRRWHVRAYCHNEAEFRDFVVGRILDHRPGGPSTISPAEDTVWRERIEVVIEPHPGLSPDQRRAIEIDYAMQGGITRLTVRCAMLFYVLTHFQLLDDEGSPAARQIRLVNTEIRALVRPPIPSPSPTVHMAAESN
jgi:hypothetical protein